MTRVGSQYDQNQWQSLEISRLWGVFLCAVPV